MTRLWMIYIGLVSILEGVLMIAALGGKPSFGLRWKASLRYAQWQFRRVKP